VRADCPATLLRIPRNGVYVSEIWAKRRGQVCYHILRDTDRRNKRGPVAYVEGFHPGLEFSMVLKHLTPTKVMLISVAAFVVYCLIVIYSLGFFAKIE
jgi:hypothetical protein